MVDCRSQTLFMSRHTVAYHTAPYHTAVHHTAPSHSTPCHATPRHSVAHLAVRTKVYHSRSLSTSHLPHMASPPLTVPLLQLVLSPPPLSCHHPSNLCDRTYLMFPCGRRSLRASSHPSMLTSPARWMRFVGASCPTMLRLPLVPPRQSLSHSSALRWQACWT